MASACSGSDEPKPNAPAPEPPASEVSPAASAEAPLPSAAPLASAVEQPAALPAGKLVPPAFETERNEEIASLASVYFHAMYGQPTDEDAQHIEVVPLLDAAARLGKAKSRRAKANAFAKLYAMPPALAARLGVLRSQALDRIDPDLRKKVDQKFANPDGSRLVDAQKLSRYVDAAMQAKSSCGASKPESKSWVDDENIIHVKTTLTVKKPVDDLRAVVDPQNWDCCGHEYFSQACVPDYDAAGQVVTLTDGITPKCKGPTPGPIPDAGSKWNGPLYERFRVAVWGLDVVYFRTIIDIDVANTKGDPEHGLTFKLNESRGGAIGFWKGKCDHDSGGVTVKPKANGNVEVTATKELRLVFKSKAATAAWTKITAATLPIAGDSLEESICCLAGQCKHP